MIATPMLTFSLWSGDNPTTVDPDLLSETLLMPGDEETLFAWDVSAENLFFGVGELFTFGLSSASFSYVFAADNESAMEPSSGYAGGELFDFLGPHATISDISFRTYVDSVAVAPVPLPPALLFLSTGIATLLFRRRVS